MPTAATAARPAAEEHKLFDPPAGPGHDPASWTLEDLVLRTADVLAVEGRAECPVCGGSLAAGGCESCGSELL